MRKLLFILILLSIPAFCYFAFDDRNWLAISSGRGTITKGCRFNICIAQTKNEIKTKLLLFRFSFAYDEKVPGSINKSFFLDSSWRRGTVWVSLENGRVVHIGWHYTLGAI
jgi:hypothetical protein